MDALPLLCHLHDDEAYDAGPVRELTDLITEWGKPNMFVSHNVLCRQEATDSASRSLSGDVGRLRHECLADRLHPSLAGAKRIIEA